MKPFKLVWLKTETIEAELDNIKEIHDIKKFVTNIHDANTINTVEGGFRIYKWDGNEYVPYNHQV